MTSKYYTNLPATSSNSTGVVEAYDTYYSTPLQLDANIFAAMTGFFESKGFSPVSSKNISVIIMKQATADSLNPMQILDSLGTLNGVEISSLVSEILNYNRVKTSFLGYTASVTPQEEILRNIVAY